MTTKIITGESLEITSSPAYYTASASTLAGHLSGIDDRFAFTDDGILSFEYIQRLGSEAQVCSLADLGSGVVLAGTSATGQIYKSTDSGATWSLVQRLGSEIYARSLADLGSGVVLAGTYPSGQVYKSTDSGATWSLVQRLGSEAYVFSLLDMGSGVVLAGTGTTGQVYKSRLIYP